MFKKSADSLYAVAGIAAATLFSGGEATVWSDARGTHIASQPLAEIRMMSWVRYGVGVETPGRKITVEIVFSSTSTTSDFIASSLPRSANG